MQRLVQQRRDHRPQFRPTILQARSTPDVKTPLDVSSQGRRYGFSCLSIDADAYERFVDWSSDAMRRLGMSLDPHVRLDNLITAGIYACESSQGGIFVCRAVDAKGSTPQDRRWLFEITRNTANRWLIKAE